MASISSTLPTNKTKSSVAAMVMLMLFGVTLAGAIAASILYFFPHLLLAEKGASFDSLDQVKRTMLSAEGKNASGVTLGSIVNPHQSDGVIYDLRPQLNTTFQRNPVQTNSCGMRDSELDHNKPTSTYRIAMLGDSFAFGWGVKEEETFTQHLESNLNRMASQALLSDSAPKNFEVLNFGVPGYSTFQEVNQFIDWGHEYKPDAVIVYFISNDFGYPFYVRDVVNPGGGILDSMSFANRLKANRDPALEQQRIQLLGLDANTSLRRLADFCKERAIRLMLVINPRKEWESHRKRLWVLKDRPDIEVIALRKAYIHYYKAKGFAEKELTLSFDPHPSPLRHKMLGDLLTPYFMHLGS
jgi:hypothetical protein